MAAVSIFLNDAAGAVMFANPEAERVFGFTLDELRGRQLFDCLLVQQADDATRLRRPDRVGTRRMDCTLRRKDGQTVNGLCSMTPMVQDNVIVGNVITIEDITERKQAEAHIHILMGEVNHRAKNLLAVVQSIARQTARDADPMKFADSLSQRLQSLSASQDLIISDDWQGVAVGALVESQLSHLVSLASGRVRIDGPPVSMTPAAAQGIGMALHELATNAIKYGALSGDAGTVQIKWQVTGDEPDRHFSMSWTEHGGPAVNPPRRQGFGHTVIERMAAYSVGGNVDLDYHVDGLNWTLTAPADQVLK
jgi:PAS domain S-box-containing protein